jgi:hypothetical protein
MPSEKEWVHSLIPKLQTALRSFASPGMTIMVSDSIKLPYAYEVFSYKGDKPDQQSLTSYETDILISDISTEEKMVPRIVIECKLESVTTHDAITYSAKAATHKNVHPYLRYGILLGNRKNYPLPGRLIRHGAHFDFMVSWKGIEPEQEDWNNLVELLGEEIEASMVLEEALIKSRSPSRIHYSILHRRLDIK